MVVKLHRVTDGEVVAVKSEKIVSCRSLSNGTRIAIETFGSMDVTEDMGTIMQMMVNSYFEGKGEQ